jgi:hypothetical protein
LSVIGWWRIVSRHSRAIEFAMFGVFFLGIGTLMFLAWVGLLIVAAADGQWAAFAELLLGLPILPFLPLIGLRWVRQVRQQRGADSSS